MLVLCLPMSLSQSIADLEALACHKAVEFAAELGLQKVIFEGDSAMIISALNQDKATLSSFGVVIEDIRSQVLVFRLLLSIMLVALVIVWLTH